MAATLVASLEGDWQPSAYTDEFRDDVLALVEERAKRGEINSVPEAAPPQRKKAEGSNVVDLMQLLQDSLKSGKKPTTRRKRAAPKKRRTAHSRATRSERTLRKSA
jgi:DNA end-binding protein Ku